MSLRTKLLLLSLLTLILPWAGWQYAQQMETTLRRGQEDALLTTARGARPRRRQRAGAALSRSRAAPRFDPARGDLFAPLLADAARCSTASPTNGRSPRVPCRASTPRAGAEAPSPRCASACIGRFMHLYVEVAQPSVRYEVPARDDNARPPASPIASIVLTRDEFGRERAWSISAIAPGPMHRARLRDRRAVEAFRGRSAVRRRACGARPARAMRSNCVRRSICSARSSPCLRSIASDAIVAQTRGARVACTPAPKR